MLWKLSYCWEFCWLWLFVFKKLFKIKAVIYIFFTVLKVSTSFYVSLIFIPMYDESQWRMQPVNVASKISVILFFQSWQVCYTSLCKIKIMIVRPTMRSNGWSINLLIFKFMRMTTLMLCSIMKFNSETENTKIDILMKL